MADIFSPEQLTQMVFLQAMVSDEAMKTRLAALIDAQTKAQAAMDELRAQEAKNAAILHDADQKLVEAATMAMNAEAVRRELDAREKTMAQVSEALNSEKARWEEIRQKVDAEQKAMAAELDERVKKLAAWEKDLASRQAGADELKAHAEMLRDTYWAKHKRLHDALSANEDGQPSA